MKKNYYLLVLISFLLFQSCATIIKGSKQYITITSYPSQATITINGQLYGKTPTAAKLFRKDHQYIKIELDGYKPYETTLKRKFNGWIFGNILIGGAIGIVIDAVTGSMYSLSPDQVSAQFRSSFGQVYKKKDDIYFAVVLEPDTSWEKIGQLHKSTR